VGSPPSESSVSGAASIPEGRQFSGSPASDPPLANTYPWLRSHEDQRHQEAWMPPVASAVTPVGTIIYQDNDGEAITGTSYAPQESNRQASYRPPCLQRHGPVLQVRPFFYTRQPSSSWSSSVYAGNFLAPLPATRCPRAANTKKRTYSCSSCGRGFSQSQVLRRHMKDKHKPQLTCPHCSSFTWSQGRPYLFRYHLQMQHPQIAPPEFRQRFQGTQRRT
jgi:DNA-directed RNA polymerase subunit RPC12/RpoP